MCNRICPANIFANNRIANDSGLNRNIILLLKQVRVKAIQACFSDKKHIRT